MESVENDLNRAEDPSKLGILLTADGAKVHDVSVHPCDPVDPAVAAGMLNSGAAELCYACFEKPGNYTEDTNG